MGTLKQTALNYSGNKDITELERVSIDLEVKTDSYTSKITKQPVTWNYIEVDGIKYSIPNKALVKMKELLEIRPTTKFIKVNKGTDGQYSVINLD